MNLIRFDFSNQEKEFYFNNIELNEFLNSFSNNQYIVINNLFAHSSTKEYNELDFSKYLSIAELQKFKDENNSVLIDTINFSINFLQVNISDEYEYIITAAEPNFSDFISKVYKLLKINDEIWGTVQNNASKYILIENCKIICFFFSFDEYLQSKYSKIL